jgi:hypothetical protein
MAKRDRLVCADERDQMNGRFALCVMPEHVARCRGMPSGPDAMRAFKFDWLYKLYYYKQSASISRRLMFSLKNAMNPL